MITLNAGQQAAADSFIQFLVDPAIKEMVLEGPAGTGKSTLVKHLLDQMENQLEFLKLILGPTYDAFTSVSIAATTHKAAHVISDMLNEPVRTIHSILSLRLDKDFSSGKMVLKDTDSNATITPCLLVIDEASFIDPALLAVIRTKARHCKVLYIGDPYQLSPMRQKDSIVFNSNMFTARLTEIVRHGGAIEQLSATYRTSVETGDFPQLIADGQSVRHLDGPNFQQAMDTAFLNGEDNIKILAWSNGRVNQYNDYILDLLNIPKEPSPGMVMVTNKTISGNGDNLSMVQTDSRVRIRDSSPATLSGIEGWFVTLTTNHMLFMPKDWSEATALSKQYAKDKSWGNYFEIKENWLDLRPPYACTVHKSQGSTYSKVFIDLSDIGRCNIASDVARMLYVAISRASSQVVLYGQLPAKYRGMPHANQPLGVFARA